MKKIIALSLVAAASIGLSACSKPANETATENSSVVIDTNGTDNEAILDTNAAENAAIDNAVAGNAVENATNVRVSTSTSKTTHTEK
ncbi:MAG: hypothetical protein ABF461_07490 [Zymomonas mobilis subsp. pomaceae]|uniref:Lipoprotein n=1 Tax=Zymomonas mobilis subsp. pomaceae (strain ATCC 29192 / DSM 22645 / JCM 10191 / CCUG 17912 / NBRC 13757 / NCIMB 11200 / NRRL B-4491 / Barker I) TaxID=579138 RepID=F8EV42_ZYMMT|nr:hypothetical protein [Zymomonas mobilis]AEI38260.1 hypothetical protein Zymop_1370 [Zymomonas mobilis subsp. pomaceae ATCC 29192]MDX5947949.1 hypothetical protein [Zymomonas mobilis subsp. pomaceae]GEB89278.1 hypothetical protein ZMO02_09150 [Zymomonas mobilis subsp. pomaceae]